MSENKKALRKSLKKWKSDLKQMKLSISQVKPEDDFLLESLTTKKEELESIIETIEKQLKGDSSVQQKT